jgi:hypothetical protein
MILTDTFSQVSLQPILKAFLRDYLITSGNTAKRDDKGKETNQVN